MLIASFLLLLVGAVLLFSGLMAGNDTLLVGAIVASLVAAVCLYAASRRPSAKHTNQARDRDSVRRSEAASGNQAGQRERGGQRRDSVPPRDEHTSEARAERDAASEEKARRGGRDEPEQSFELEVSESGLNDEPGEVQMSSVEAAALMRMDAEVMVVDGRPRFHLGGCVHLVGRDSEPLPAYEAVELGFTACALCRPAQSLLGEPSRR